MEGPPKKTPNYYNRCYPNVRQPPEQTRIMLMMVAGTTEAIMLFCRFHDPWLLPCYKIWKL